MLNQSVPIQNIKNQKQKSSYAPFVQGSILRFRVLLVSDIIKTCCGFLSRMKNDFAVRFILFAVIFDA